jgi:hypothetical protein
MKTFALLAVGLIAGCAESLPTSKTTVTIIYPEIEMDQSARIRLEQAKDTALRPITSPEFATGVLGTDPQLASLVTKAEVRYVRVISEVQVFVTARTHAAALEPGRMIASAATARGNREAPQESGIQLRLLDQPVLVTP